MSAVKKEPGVSTGSSEIVELEKKKREYKDFGHDNDGPTSPPFIFQCSSPIDAFFLFFRGSRRYGHRSYRHKPFI
jgi:hypothetical protein